MILPKHEYELVCPIDFSSMYELGNKKNKYGTYKSQFERMGIHHISIDLNGKDGALPLDLQEPIDLPSRDIITNFGCSEHVMNQEMCFKNMHNLTHYRSVGFVPRVGSSPHHGYWGVDTDFFFQLAELNKYKVKLVEVAGTPGREIVRYSFYKLFDSEFVWDDSLPMEFKPKGHGGVKK